MQKKHAIYLAYATVIALAMGCTVVEWAATNNPPAAIPVYLAGIIGPILLLAPPMWEYVGTDTARRPHAKRVFLLVSGTAVWASLLWLHSLREGETMLGGYMFTAGGVSIFTLLATTILTVIWGLSRIWNFFEGKSA